MKSKRLTLKCDPKKLPEPPIGQTKEYDIRTASKEAARATEDYFGARKAKSTALYKARKKK